MLCVTLTLKVNDTNILNTSISSHESHQPLAFQDKKVLKKSKFTNNPKYGRTCHLLCHATLSLPIKMSCSWCVWLHRHTYTHTHTGFGLIKWQQSLHGRELSIRAQATTQLHPVHFIQPSVTSSKLLSTVVSVCMCVCM